MRLIIGCVLLAITYTDVLVGSTALSTGYAKGGFQAFEIYMFSVFWIAGATWCLITGGIEKFKKT